jgi:rhodanese-related sulfurtransferase
MPFRSAARKYLRILKPVSWAILLLGSSCLVGCNKEYTDNDVTIVGTSAEAVDLMTKSRGTFGLSGAPNATWLDPREEAEYAKGHIPGALNLPFSRLDAEQAVVLQGIEVIVVYDADSDAALSMAAAKHLMDRGHKEVCVLKGGLKAWKRDGNPVETGPPKKS